MRLRGVSAKRFECADSVLLWCESLARSAAATPERDYRRHHPLRRRARCPRALDSSSPTMTTALGRRLRRLCSNTTSRASIDTNLSRTSPAIPRRD